MRVKIISTYHAAENDDYDTSIWLDPRDFSSAEEFARAADKWVEEITKRDGVENRGWEVDQWEDIPCLLIDEMEGPVPDVWNHYLPLIEEGYPIMALQAYADHGDYGRDLSEFRDYYAGFCYSKRDFAEEHYKHEVEATCGKFAKYIDWEAVLRDMASEGWLMLFGGDARIYVFFPEHIARKVQQIADEE